MTLPESEMTQRPDLAAIMAELDNAGEKLPVQAIEAARRHKEQIIPELIGAIQRATQMAREGKKVTQQGHFFALFLLAEFRAVAVLPAILEAVSLPGEAPHELFGDAISEDLPRVLLALAGEK